jgi:hypothetical protein
MTPMKRFIKKKFPTIIVRTKKIAGKNDLTLDLSGALSAPFILVA